MKLPKAEQKHEKWQVAVSCLFMAAEGRGPVMFARIGVLQALHRNVERVFNRDRNHHSFSAVGAQPRRAPKVRQAISTGYPSLDGGGGLRNRISP
jgi:hypothetical protein